MENILEFITNLFLTNGVVIAVAAFVVGQVIKGFEKVPKNIIPLTGGCLGVVLGVLIPDLFPNCDVVTSAIMGLALGWAATGGYETIKHFREEK